MNGFSLRLTALAALGAAALCCISCSTNAQNVTPEQEAAWKNPPKQPPPEYKGNTLGSPGAPPSGKPGTPGTPGAPPPGGGSTPGASGGPAPGNGH